MTDYPLSIRLARGHLAHRAFSRRTGLMPPRYTTACGHTFNQSGVADLAATGTPCHGCRIATQELKAG
ncbi:hypothetical protein [Streptomyces atriruber]|uniref:hypothetical protein n=1 Tax=Streptomyces atriruber TaxID=545121 RepID=UPI0006E276BC|nr:hypothetical protein [Streptomyces atriruber]